MLYLHENYKHPNTLKIIKYVNIVTLSYLTSCIRQAPWKMYAADLFEISCNVSTGVAI